MTLKLSLTEVKSIVKTIGKSVSLKIKDGSIFVEPALSLSKEKNRHFFFVSKGGHGVGKWATGMAANWLSNVAQGAAGLDASGLGALGGGIASASGKASGLGGLAGGFRDGVIRDARSLEAMSGAGNLLHVLKEQDALVYFGALDTWGTVSWGLWGGLPSDSGQWNYYVRQLKTERAVDTSYQFEGSYLKGKGVLSVGGEMMKLKK